MNVILAGSGLISSELYLICLFIIVILEYFRTNLVGQDTSQLSR